MLYVQTQKNGGFNMKINMKYGFSRYIPSGKHLQELMDTSTIVSWEKTHYNQRVNGFCPIKPAGGNFQEGSSREKDIKEVKYKGQLLAKMFFVLALSHGGRI